MRRPEIDNALLELYAKYKPQKGTKVVLLTWVIGDGLGDYSAQLETAKILSEAIAEIDITLITFCYEKAKLHPSSFSQVFVPYTSDLKWEKIECTFSDELLEILRSAALILQIPTYFPKTKELLELCPGVKHELVGEGGWINTPHFHPSTGARCMGLHPMEKGIFIKKIPKTELCTDKRSHLVYTLYSEGFCKYMRVLLKYLEKDNQNIDIYFFKLGHLLENIEKIPFKKYGIKNALIYYKKNVCELAFASVGKTIHFFHKENIPQEEFLTLLAQTTDLVGCRGDGSIFETISANKIPFFDVPEHQKKFLKNVIHLAEENKLRRAVKYLKSDHPEKMGKMLQSAKLTEEIKTLNQIIREKHSVNPILINLTLRALYHYKHPNLALLESVVLDSDAPSHEVLAEIKHSLILP